jgi:hypothetical protein
MVARGFSRAEIDAFPRGKFEGQMTARDLLSHLGIDNLSKKFHVHFLHETGSIFIRACIVDERDFNTVASPAWMAKP